MKPEDCDQNILLPFSLQCNLACYRYTSTVVLKRVDKESQVSYRKILKTGDECNTSVQEYREFRTNGHKLPPLLMALSSFCYLSLPPASRCLHEQWEILEIMSVERVVNDKSRCGVLQGNRPMTSSEVESVPIGDG